MHIFHPIFQDFPLLIQGLFEKQNKTSKTKQTWNIIDKQFFFLLLFLVKITKFDESCSELQLTQQPGTHKAEIRALQIENDSVRNGARNGQMNYSIKF